MKPTAIIRALPLVALVAIAAITFGACGAGEPASVTTYRKFRDYVVAKDYPSAYAMLTESSKKRFRGSGDDASGLKLLQSLCEGSLKDAFTTLNDVKNPNAEAGSQKVIAGTIQLFDESGKKLRDIGPWRAIEESGWKVEWMLTLDPNARGGEDPTAGLERPGN